MVEILDKLLSRSKRWEHLGVRTFSDGTRLIGKIPSQEQGYLLRFYGPLTEEEVEQLDERYKLGGGFGFPSDLKLFFRCCNGCNLFQNKLAVHGLQRSLLDRSDFDAMHCLPFDILLPALANMEFSPSGKGTRISSYDGGTLIFVEPEGAVVRVNKSPSTQILNTWDNLESWLLSEFDRISSFYDNDGSTSNSWLEMIPPPEITN